MSIFKFILTLSIPCIVIIIASCKMEHDQRRQIEGTLPKSEVALNQELDTSMYSSANVVKGVVANERTAVLIADAILIPIYGEIVKNKRPYKVELLKGGIWYVSGTLSGRMIGGVPHIYIRAKDCKIIQHYSDR